MVWMSRLHLKAPLKIGFIPPQKAFAPLREPLLRTFVMGKKMPLYKSLERAAEISAKEFTDSREERFDKYL